jgi:hypothetical protein
LTARVQRERDLLDTIGPTIADLKGQTTITDQDLCKGFSPERQEAHQAWLLESGGPDKADWIADSKQALGRLDPARIADAQQELAPMDGALAQACRDGLEPTDPSLAPLPPRHRD